MSSGRTRLWRRLSLSMLIAASRADASTYTRVAAAVGSNNAAGAAEIAAWVEANFTARQIDCVTVYDLTGNSAQPAQTVHSNRKDRTHVRRSGSEI